MSLPLTASTEATAPATVPSPSANATAHSASAKTWMVGPWFDALLVANVGWPLIVLASWWFFPASEANPLQFVQVYFISTPHRWITLLLVFLEPNYFPSQAKRFLSIGGALISLGLILAYLGSLNTQMNNSLYILMMVDFSWNAWHFASQHVGIARIYSRLGKRSQTEDEIVREKAAIRVMVLWFFLRAAVYLGTIAPGGRYPEYAWTNDWLRLGDLLVLYAPLALLLRELRRGWANNGGRTMYLGSVIGVYMIQMAALQVRDDGFLRGAFVAGALFHALEYLAVAGWTMSKKTQGVMAYLAPRVTLVVLTFMLVLGISDWIISTRWFYAYSLLTLLISLLHYGYDGMIWKSPRPKSAPAVVNHHN